MKTTRTFDEKFYENLYNEIINYADENFCPEYEDDTTCSMEFEIGKFSVLLTATFEVELIDDSFDHAFGTEHAYHLEVGYLTDLEVEQIWESNDDNDLEDDVTDDFDMEMFWDQFKQYGTKNIKPGDEVIALIPGWPGRTERATYLYTDTMKNRHICKYSFHTIEASRIKLPA